ncbi:MAG: SUMF1/EgtB/PvdO family nonheme iron enzyme [Glaciecola sp.]
MQQEIDQRIKKAQRKGIGVYLVSGGLTAVLFIGFLIWLFLVKGFNIIIGPVDALPTAQIKVIKGYAWVSGNRLYTLSGNVGIEVSANTFQTSTLNINEQSPSTINVTLLPSPATIEVSVDSEDSQFAAYNEQTQWSLNGSLIHVGKSLKHTTPPGNYQLLVDNPYYEVFTTDLNLERAENRSLQAQLKPIAGALQIDSTPQGIKVSVNGQQVGTTPITHKVQGGLHNVSLTSDEYQNVNEEIALQRGFLLPSRNYQMAPKQGELMLSLEPAGGVLLVNNVEYAPGSILLDANKRHKVSYSKAGYSSFNKNISVTASKPTSLDIQLQAQSSAVSFVSNVAATVSVNGKNIGTTPTIVTLPSISHSVVFAAPGYRTQTKQFTANKNAPTQVSVELLTEFDARRAERKPLFISGLGISMTRFNGTPFTMGSPANESGRRRNEHQVDVDFSRPFWVSNTEITRQQLAAFTQQKVTQGKFPATDISWTEAALYCNWLSAQEGLPEFYVFRNARYVGVNAQSRGYRLPTEAEWEWLAKKSKRAASTTYVWGNQEKLRNKLGNFADEGRKSKQLIVLQDYQDEHVDLAPVASYKADRNGMFDLAGNVSEWVHDAYTNSLPNTSVTHVDYLGASRSDAWVIKGGNYESGRLRELRAAYREFSSTGKPTVGFRIARYHN